MKTLRAVFFDMDGLIIDTETPDFHAWKEVLADVGIGLPFETWLSRVGQQDDWNRFADELGVPVPLRGELRARKRVRYMELIRADLRTLPGFDGLLLRCRRAGLVCAVVSTAGREWVDLILGELGILSAFDFTLSGNDAPRGKPHPDLYLLAARKADAGPSECLVFEDSSNGVLAAHRAGIPVVAVPNGITRHHDLSRANAVVGSLEEADDALLHSIGLRFPETRASN